MLAALDHPNITHDWFTTVLLRVSGDGLLVYDRWLIDNGGVHLATQVTGTVVLDIYYLMYLVSFMMVFVLFARWRRDGWLKVREHVVYDAVLISLTATLIGAKAAYIFIYNPDFYFKEPQTTGEMLHRIFLNWSGMASHGAAFAIVFSAWLWWLKSRAPVVHMGDVGCTAGAFGAICVRLANFLNGELYGRETSVPWAMHFKVKNSHGNALYVQGGKWFEQVSQQQPDGSFFKPTQPYHLGYELIQKSGDSVRHIDPAHVPLDLQNAWLQVVTSPRHPSQLYQLVLEGLLVFSFMIFMRKRVKRAGVLAGIFFAGYAGARFIGEFFREPDKQFQSAENPMGTVLGPLSMGQLLSLGMLAFGVGVIIYFSKRGRLINEIPMWPAAKKNASDTLTSDPSETAAGSVGKSTVITKAMEKR